MHIDEDPGHSDPVAPRSVAFRIEMLPAGEGDCLLVTVPGDESDFRILVDTGNGRPALDAIRARLTQLPINNRDGLRHVNLFIITHIDDDHLEHAAELLKDPDLKLSFDDIWFNGYYELESERPRAVDFGVLSENQADILTTVLHDRNLPHNKAFDHGPVQVPEVPGEPPTMLATSKPSRSSGSFLRKDLGPEAPQITLLSPLPQDLRELGREWNSREHPLASDGEAADVDRLWSGAAPAKKKRAPIPSSRADLKRLAAGPFTPEETRANICSIAVLLEHRGRRLLLTGDGHPHVYEPALEALVKDVEQMASRPDDTAERPAFVIDVVKVAHHGSSDNTSRTLRAYRASDYLISTNGERHGHPDSESLARLIVDAEVPPTFHFNFPTQRVLRWASLAAALGDFAVVHPPVGATIQISPVNSPTG